ncbi:MAG: hypothetical protein KHW39_08135, partial [Megasphaera micronuciformis]|nr:hypothetical protein [Megasphaera micronuciformis]
MMAGMGSIMYIFIVIGIVCLILSGYKLMHFFGSNAEEGYNILHFTKDSVTINTGFFPPTYKLKDIAEVRFSKGRARGRISTREEESTVDDSKIESSELTIDNETTKIENIESGK